MSSSSTTRDRVSPKGRILLVDDEPMIISAFGRMLSDLGYDVVPAQSGAEAITALAAGNFDVVVSDILMPGMDGMSLLRAIRERDLDVPVVLLTGNPSLDSAMKAVEFGALRYLTKPVDPGELAAVVRRAVGLRRVAGVRRDAVLPLGQARMQVSDRAGAEAAMQRALKGLWMAFQPIVCFSTRRVWAYEALVRSTEPVVATPGALFDVAEKLGILDEVGRALRLRVAAAASKAPGRAHLLVNVHASDLKDDDLFDPRAPLSRIASRVVLEITERASLEDIPDLRDRVATLRKVGFRLAVDDVGAGYAGLGSFARLEPDVAKLDMLFVRGIETDSTKQQLVRSLVGLCHDLHTEVVAEGIETEAERKTLVGLGCDLHQGWLYGKADRNFLLPDGFTQA